MSVGGHTSVRNDPYGAVLLWGRGVTAVPHSPSLPRLVSCWE